MHDHFQAYPTLGCLCMIRARLKPLFFFISHGELRREFTRVDASRGYYTRLKTVIYLTEDHFGDTICCLMHIYIYKATCIYINRRTIALAARGKEKEKCANGLHRYRAAIGWRRARVLLSGFASRCTSCDDDDICNLATKKRERERETFLWIFC